ncbi:MAG: hypothetical protein RL722_1052 [Pseudomonadota bacterium]
MADSPVSPASAPPAAAPQVVHHPEMRRFTALVEGRESELAYRPPHAAADPGAEPRPVVDFVHTGVPRALEGRGIAAALVAAGLAWAREQGLAVRPVCSYVRVYMRRHPETADLLPRA